MLAKPQFNHLVPKLKGTLLNCERKRKSIRAQYCSYTRTWSLCIPISVCACVSSRPFTQSPLLRSTEAHRDASPARCVAVFLAPVHRFFFFCKTNDSSSPRCKTPSPFFRFSSLGSSHAAVKAQDTGRFVIDQAAARWIWRVLGTQTRSPLRYLPPKLNSRFLAGEYRLLFIHLSCCFCCEWTRHMYTCVQMLASVWCLAVHRE